MCIYSAALQIFLSKLVQLGTLSIGTAECQSPHSPQKEKDPRVMLLHAARCTPLMLFCNILILQILDIINIV